MLAVIINIGLHTIVLKVGLEFEVCWTVERPGEGEYVEWEKEGEIFDGKLL